MISLANELSSEELSYKIQAIIDFVQENTVKRLECRFNRTFDVPFSCGVEVTSPFVAALAPFVSLLPFSIAAPLVLLSAVDDTSALSSLDPFFPDDPFSSGDAEGVSTAGLASSGSTTSASALDWLSLLVESVESFESPFSSLGVAATVDPLVVIGSLELSSVSGGTVLLEDVVVVGVAEAALARFSPPGISSSNSGLRSLAM